LDLFRYMASEGHEQLIVGYDRETGLQALIAIHDTTLGPALGGCRLWAYRTFEDAAMDALRLSKIMTYKAAISGLPFGGGKAVINARPQDKTPALLAAFGRLIDSMAGLYITAEDVGMTVADLVVIKQVTRYATGVPEDQGGGGDPSVFTAIGVFHGMRRCLQEALGEDSLKDRTVAIQGLGKVGMQLAHLLHQEGANLIVTDLNRGRHCSGDNLDPNQASFQYRHTEALSVAWHEHNIAQPINFPDHSSIDVKRLVRILSGIKHEQHFLFDFQVSSQIQQAVEVSQTLLVMRVGRSGY